MYSLPSGLCSLGAMLAEYNNGFAGRWLCCTEIDLRRFQGLPVLLISSFVIHSNNVPKFSRAYIQPYVYNKSAHCHIIFFCTITCSTIQYLNFIAKKFSL